MQLSVSATDQIRLARRRLALGAVWGAVCLSVIIGVLLVDLRAALLAVVAGFVGTLCIGLVRRGLRELRGASGGELCCEDGAITWTGTPRRAGLVSSATQHPDFFRLQVADEALDLPLSTADAGRLSAALEAAGVDVQVEHGVLARSLRVGIGVGIVMLVIVMVKVVLLTLAIGSVIVLWDHGWALLGVVAVGAPLWLAYEGVQQLRVRRARAALVRQDARVPDLHPSLRSPPRD